MAGAFGTQISRTMAVARYDAGGWSTPALEKTAPLALDPAAHVLHYSSSCFEGLKAYRHDDGSVHAFRLDRHCARFAASAEVLCLPMPPVALVRSMILDLVAACRDDIPPYPGALYIRPVLLGTEPNIGAAAKASSEALLFVLASPVGDYFQGGEKPLKLMIEESGMRSAPHFGMVKTGGNYASALRCIQQAREAFGADQVLFCPDGQVQETGAANFLLLDDQRIMTKGLDSAILHGVTRDSLLSLGGELGYEIVERDFTVDQLLEWVTHGEAALSGTAAVLASVGSIVRGGVEHHVGDGGIGANAKRLRKALADIHAGRAADTFDWLTEVPA